MGVIKYKVQYAKDNYKRIPLDVKKWEYESWKEFADKHNIPLATMIKTAVKQYIDESMESDAGG